MRHLLALDAGTGSGRAVLFDQFGRQVAASGREWTHKRDPRYPGSMEFDMPHNWGLLKACIHDVLGQTPDANVVGVSTTSMREGIALYDENIQALWACANVDARAIQEVRDLRAQNSDLEYEIYLKSGQTFAWARRHACCGSSATSRKSTAAPRTWSCSATGLRCGWVRPLMSIPPTAALLACSI